MRFDDKRVIVTGAGGGFGAAIARGFAAKGAKVMVTDIDVTAAQAVADELDGALAFGLDVTSEDAHKELADVVVEAWGGIDIVACNAGLPHRGGYMVNLTTEQFDFMWTINVRPIFFASKYFVPHMAAGGAIVSTASIGGRRPRKGLTPYNASKAAVITLTKGLAVELAPDIRVNCVAPVSSPTGFDMSAMGIEKLSENREKMVVDGITMGRRATPEDVANSVMFLASEEAGFLTGVCLDVDCGRSIG